MKANAPRPPARAAFSICVLTVSRISLRDFNVSTGGAPDIREREGEPSILYVVTREFMSSARKVATYTLSIAIAHLLPFTVRRSAKKERTESPRRTSFGRFLRPWPEFFAVNFFSFLLRKSPRQRTRPPRASVVLCFFGGVFLLVFRSTSVFRDAEINAVETRRRVGKRQAEKCDTPCAISRLYKLDVVERKRKLEIILQ